MAISTLAEDLLFRVDDWENSPDNGNRYEIIEGEVFVSTAPRFIHQLLIIRIAGALRDYLKQNPIGEVLPTPGVILSKKDAVIPDVIFISRERLNQFLLEDKIQGAPELVIEILLPGKANVERDRVTKLKLYSRFPVEEYWVVNPMKKQIEVFRAAPNGLRLIQTLGERETLTSPLFSNFSLQIEELFRS